MGDILAAAGTLTLRYRVAVGFAAGKAANADVAAMRAAALMKLGERRADQGQALGSGRARSWSPINPAGSRVGKTFGFRSMGPGNRS